MFVFGIAGAACATAPASREIVDCTVSDADLAWINSALEAWRFVSHQVSDIAPVPNARAVFFDSSCVLTSDDALATPVSLDRVTWSATPHSGTVPLPDGEQMPVGVTSFASGDGDVIYFAMSTPSVWSAGGVSGGVLPLETMMIAVLLHEASHIAQIGPYGRRLARLLEQYGLPDDFHDDSMQLRFQDDAGFAASVQRETDLFMQAAAAASDAEARRLARAARDLMRARAQRWFTGPDSYWAEAEDIWLTFEGAGQWIGYQWLVHPQGAAVPPSNADARWVSNRWWSQTEGFAAVSALHRIVGPRWQAEAYGEGSQTVLEMIDAALAW